MFQMGPLIYWMWTAKKFHNRLIVAKHYIYTGRIKYQNGQAVLKATIKKEEWLVKGPIFKGHESRDKQNLSDDE